MEISKILTTVIKIVITAHAQSMLRYALTSPSTVKELFAVARGCTPEIGGPIEIHSKMYEFCV